MMVFLTRLHHNLHTRYIDVTTQRRRNGIRAQVTYLTVYPGSAPKHVGENVLSSYRPDIEWRRSAAFDVPLWIKC